VTALTVEAALHRPLFECSLSTRSEHNTSGYYCLQCSLGHLDLHQLNDDPTAGSWVPNPFDETRGERRGKHKLKPDTRSQRESKSPWSASSHCWRSSRPILAA
jgi:hypothetical protein